MLPLWPAHLLFQAERGKPLKWTSARRAEVRLFYGIPRMARTA